MKNLNKLHGTWLCEEIIKKKEATSIFLVIHEKKSYTKNITMDA